jgi:hypothetical protein
MLKSFAMKTINEIRLQNLEQLIVQFAGGSATRFAELVGTSTVYLSQMRRGTPTASGENRSVGDKMARQIESALKLEIGSIDHESCGTNNLEQQLLQLFRALSQDDQDKVLHEANYLFNKANPIASSANPFARTKPHATT